jgi:hypothetical protein
VPQPPSLPRPPPPPPETLQGIGRGIHEIQVQQLIDSGKIGDVVQKVDDLSLTVGIHGRDIRSIKGKVDRLEATVEDHTSRLVEIERLPNARSSHSYELDRYDPDETPGGGIRVDHAIWDTIRTQRAEMEQALSEVREQLSAVDQAREIEAARAAGAEEREARLHEKAKRTRERWTVLIVTVVPLVSAIAYVLARIAH